MVISQVTKVSVAAAVFKQSAVLPRALQRGPSPDGCNAQGSEGRGRVRGGWAGPAVRLAFPWARAARL